LWLFLTSGMALRVMHEWCQSMWSLCLTVSTNALLLQIELVAID